MASAFNIDEFSVDAVVFARQKICEGDVTLENRVIASIGQIELTMDWYDHVAAAFLLIEDPKKALEVIQAVMESYQSGAKEWHKLVITPFFEQTKMWINLIDVLFILKHKKLLKFLEVDVHSSFKAVNLNQFRLKLFHIIDDLCEDKAQELVARMNSKIKEPILEKTWSVEMHFLKWIETGEISEQDYLKLLTEINSSSIPIPIEKLQRNSSELANKMPIKESPISPTKCIIKNGLCIIINQMHFRVDPSLEPGLLKQARSELGFRYGSDGDRDKLAETFKMLGHNVVIYENLKYHQLHATMKKVSEDFRQYDALVVCILSHGKKDSIFTSDCIPVTLDEIKSYFCGISCLVDKPKLFFLQACQGEENQTSVYPCAGEHCEADGNPIVKPIVKALPSDANFFEGWATVPGYYSYRSTTTGAIFIRALCLVLQSCNHEECDLSDIMTMVNDKVAYWHSNDKKQMSCNNSSLTKKVHFQRRKDSFIEAIIDQLEREILDKSIKLASYVIWNNDRRLAYQIINSNVT